MNGGNPEEEEDDDDRRGPKPTRMQVVEMDKVRIREVIDDPHQRLLYEYDFLNPKVFLLNLPKYWKPEIKPVSCLCEK